MPISPTPLRPSGLASSCSSTKMIFIPGSVAVPQVPSGAITSAVTSFIHSAQALIHGAFEKLNRVAVLASFFPHLGVAQRRQEALVDQRGVADLHGGVEHDAILMRVRLLPFRDALVHEAAGPFRISAEMQSARCI